MMFEVYNSSDYRNVGYIPCHKCNMNKQAYHFISNGGLILLQLIKKEYYIWGGWCF